MPSLPFFGRTRLHLNILAIVFGSSQASSFTSIQSIHFSSSLIFRRESDAAAEQQAAKQETLTQSLREAQRQLASWQAEATRARQGETSAKRALEGYASQGTDGAINKLLAELQATQAELHELRKSHQQPQEPQGHSKGGPLTPLPPASEVGKSTGSAGGGAAAAASGGNGGGGTSGGSVNGHRATTALARGAEGSQRQWTEASDLSQSQSQSQSLIPLESRQQDQTLDTAQMRGEIFGSGCGGAMSARVAAASSMPPPPPPEPHAVAPSSSSLGSASNTHVVNEAAEAWRARAESAEASLANARAEAASLVASYQKLQEEVRPHNRIPVILQMGIQM